MNYSRQCVDYLMVSRDVLNNPNITFGAKGVYSYLCGLNSRGGMPALSELELKKINGYLEELKVNGIIKIDKCGNIEIKHKPKRIKE